MNSDIIIFVYGGIINFILVSIGTRIYYWKEIKTLGDLLFFPKERIKHQEFPVFWGYSCIMPAFGICFTILVSIVFLIIGLTEVYEKTGLGKIVNKILNIKIKNR